MFGTPEIVLCLFAQVLFLLAHWFIFAIGWAWKNKNAFAYSTYLFFIVLKRFYRIA
jgi:hypothetical protein